MQLEKKHDVVVVGAGASGLMVAIEAAKRGRSVVVLESSKKPGRKILMAGGGYCNFTNYHIQPRAYISHNPHFCKSALSQYTQWDFIDLVDQYEIAYHEKTKGQLFCDVKGGEILQMLLAECVKYQVEIRTQMPVHSVLQSQEGGYELVCQNTHLKCQSLVVATGGLSIPSMGSSPWGYRLAEQFGIKVHPTRAGLVPFTLHVEDKEKFSQLAGLSFDAEVSCEKIEFDEACLFTHRGLSGPAILQISSYWDPGSEVRINALPDRQLKHMLESARRDNERKQVNKWFAQHLPRRMVDVILPASLSLLPVSTLSNAQIMEICGAVQNWCLKPNATEGYRTAEVTVGGVDCNAISSKTMESKQHKGLFFVGEVLDVTGWLGGYNFQWAWSSGFAAGQVV